MRRFLVLCALGASTAHADPVASATDPAPTPGPVHDPAHDPTPAATDGEPVSASASEPDPAALAAAPAADQASGIAVPGPRERHPILNTLLAIPRETAVVLLTGPRYAAGELDDYLESRSPNAFGRGAKKRSWRFGATADYESVLGGSLGLRVGRELGDGYAVDAYGGLFGARGQSGGIKAELGVIRLHFDAGRDMERAFAGIGEAAPRVTYEQQRVAASAGVHLETGPLVFRAKVIGDVVRDRDDDMQVAAVYDPTEMFGFAERQRALTGEASLTLDTRRPDYPWIRRSAPSSGTYVRATGAYLTGDADREGRWSTGRATLEARELFDLFHGDRVLSIGGRADTITADANEVPFDRLPALGGPQRMRALARDQLRAKSSAYADLRYEWTLGGDSRGYVFAEAGEVGPGLNHVDQFHYGYGGGVRFLNGSSTAAEVQLAGADTGDIGLFLQIGAL